MCADDWLKYDDDNVSPCTSEDVLKLSGGGMAERDLSCGYFDDVTLPSSDLRRLAHGVHSHVSFIARYGSAEGQEGQVRTLAFEDHKPAHISAFNDFDDFSVFRLSYIAQSTVAMHSNHFKLVAPQNVITAQTQLELQNESRNSPIRLF